MNFSKKNHELVGQNEQIVKKSQKHEANLQKNTTLYFQVGLILTLLVTYGLFEMQFETKEIFIEPPIQIEEGIELYVFNDNIIVYDEDAPKEEEKKTKPIVFTDPEIIEDEAKEEVFKEFENVVSTSITPPIKVADIPNIIEEEEEMNIYSVEQVPIYPGCENYKINNKRRKCMSDKIDKLVGRKFNSDLAGELDLSGKQRINVQFKIDKLGNVVEIKARAPHNKLEKEAMKVINYIPKMIPGKQKDKNVSVIYRLPIILQVQN